MSKIYIPTNGPADWQRLLADPERHWKTGYSAKSLAACWESAGGELPPEVRDLFAGLQGLGQAPELLAAFPEWKVSLPGGRADSQNDVFALIRCGHSTIATMVEGKVAETFGPTVDEWLTDASAGKQERLGFIRSTLGLQTDIPANIRYQLLHRAASAMIEAERFKTDAAAIIVHSFSSDTLWFDDFRAFCVLLGTAPRDGALDSARIPVARWLYLGWAKGEARYLQA